MKKTICLLIVCLMCAFSYGKTTPVMAEEKEKVMIVTGSDSITKVVAIALMKADLVFACVSGKEFKEPEKTFKSPFSDYEKIDPEYIDFEVREKPNFYNYLHTPINSKPFKQNIKFERNARNAI